MSLVINNNMMAANVARNLNTHYGRLSKSTQRLSSGLRINSAADDAAGLAIRELQRTEIASLHQGVRNANDAISMIQVADGALQVIDEKLIRMKELAEQAATGTYTSDQRIIIDSEYQAMAAEITRIANATDFNGIHLLNGELESSVHNGSGLNPKGKLKIHFGTGNDSAEDYYYIQIGNSTAEALGLGSGKTVDFALNRTAKLAYEFAYNWHKERFGDTEKSEKIAQNAYDYVNKFFSDAINNDNHRQPTQDEWRLLSSTEKEALKKKWGDSAAINLIDNGANGRPGVDQNIGNRRFNNTEIEGNVIINALRASDRDLDNPSINALIDSLARYAGETFRGYTDEAGTTISTQDAAQRALDAVNNAVVSKDKIRAHLGALQNRLENTITNLNIQAENLQAAESRISDVDVATEMTEFVRQQILAQSAVAMLAQANTLPQMAMQLISG